MGSRSNCLLVLSLRYSIIISPLDSNADADPGIYFLLIVDDDDADIPNDNERNSATLTGLALKPAGQKRGQFHRVGRLTLNTRTACDILRSTFGTQNIPEALYQDLWGRLVHHRNRLIERHVRRYARLLKPRQDRVHFNDR